MSTLDAIEISFRSPFKLSLSRPCCHRLDAVARDLRMAIGNTEYRPGVREKLDRVRSELDDWV